jgi:hypothetical protein
LTILHAGTFITIRNNLFADIDHTQWGGDRRLFQLLAGTADVVIEHNTAFQTCVIIMAEGASHTGFVYRDNIMPHNAYGVIIAKSNEPTTEESML